MLRRLRLAALLLAAGTGTAAPGPVDRRILPATATYTRNPTCAPVQRVDPNAKRILARDPGISPPPADTPLGQGDTAICFAYATADMISQRVGIEVSPLDVATKFYFADPARLYADPALRRHLAAHPGTLADIAWSRNAVDIAPADNPGLQPYFDKLEGGEEDAAALLYNLGGLCAERDLPSHEGYTRFAKWFLAARFGTRVRAPNMSFARVGATVDKLRSRRADALNAAWIAHTDALCRRTKPPVPLLPVSYRLAANQLEFMEMVETGRAPRPREVARMLAMVDYALDNGRIPTVGYSWYVLEERDPKDPDIAADHSSTVIARRRSGGSCQYLVQDNTGEYCARMRPDIAARCEMGRIWLNEDELKRSLYSVIYLR